MRKLWELMRKARRALRLRAKDPIDNLVYQALERSLRQDSNCIDVGAHAGAILERIVELAPLGKHTAIEPLPEFAARLRRSFPCVVVHEVALADTPSGLSEFQHVVRAPAFSGLRRRRYERQNEAIECIAVTTGRLDDLIASSHRVDLIKIDVEGGELGVLRGARRMLREQHPALIFEHGLGGADFYGTRPADLYAFLAEQLGYEIFTLEGWLNARPPLDLAAMEREFDEYRSYMFFAVARRKGGAAVTP